MCLSNVYKPRVLKAKEDLVGHLIQLFHRYTESEKYTNPEEHGINNRYIGKRTSRFCVHCTMCVNEIEKLPFICEQIPELLYIILIIVAPQ